MLIYPHTPLLAAGLSRNIGRARAGAHIQLLRPHLTAALRHQRLQAVPQDAARCGAREREASQAAASGGHPPSACG